MLNLSLPANRNLDPDQLHSDLAAGGVVLIDVREPEEHRAERIDGAINHPLSSFDPSCLLVPNGKRLVLHCVGGVRSAKALEACLRAGMQATRHLAGGLNAWKARGLPTVR